MNTIRVISENDLQHIKKMGKRIRALCPIHNSRDRDLSIAPYSEYLDEDDQRLAGFGYCHSANCGATVLVQEWNPAAASRILGRPVMVKEPKVSITAGELEKAEAWQRRELDGINKIYPHAASQLRHERASSYLAQRGLGEQEAVDLLESLGVAYIPPAEEWKSPPPDALRKWCDRIIFPFTTRDGERGYIGRTLHLWQSGMDENEHKQLLVEYDKRMEEEHGKDAAQYQIRRWRKTYRSGFFNASVMTESRLIYICEGPFDVIPLLLAGLSNVVAVAGTHIDSKAIPKNVFDVVLAFDADMHGQSAMERTTDLLAAAGITPDFCSPPDDGNGKDWSERYRRCGVEGLTVLFELHCDSEERFPQDGSGFFDDDDFDEESVPTTLLPDDSPEIPAYSLVIPDEARISLSSCERTNYSTNEVAPSTKMTTCRWTYSTTPSLRTWQAMTIWSMKLR